MPVQVGGNLFNSLFPLVVGDRYFMVESGGKGNLITVLAVRDNKAVAEVDRNQRGEESPDVDYQWQRIGYIVITDKSTGHFIYKIRPDYKTSILFGDVPFKDITPDGETFDVKISDKGITTSKGGLIKNSSIDALVGLRYSADGLIIGSSVVHPDIVRWIMINRLEYAYLLR